MFGRTKSNISNGNFPFSEINDKNLNFGRDYALGDFIYEDLLHCTAVPILHLSLVFWDMILPFLVSCHKWSNL